jgi:hypothetical protein
MEMKLDGRKFHGVTDAMTSVQDDYIMTQLRRSGATDVLLGIEASTDEERRARSREMFDRILESGRKYRLLAGLLIEEGKTWNQEEAEKNAARFAAIIDTEEKLTMNREVMRHVQFFFRPETESLKTSPNSSNQSSEVPVTASAEGATSEISRSSSAP